MVLDYIRKILRRAKKEEKKKLPSIKKLKHEDKRLTEQEEYLHELLMEKSKSRAFQRFAEATKKRQAELKKKPSKARKKKVKSKGKKKQQKRRKKKLKRTQRKPRRKKR